MYVVNNNTTVNVIILQIAIIWMGGGGFYLKNSPFAEIASVTGVCSSNSSLHSGKITSRHP